MGSTTNGVPNCNYAACNRFTGTGGMLPLPFACKERIHVNAETNRISCREFVKTKCEAEVGPCTGSFNVEILPA